MLTVFANIRINSKESFQHLKDSFESFSDVSDNWLINVRGKERLPALEFLKHRLGSKGVFFELLDDSRGWITNALEMLPHAKHPYILMWNEDHMNIAPQGVLKNVTDEMQKFRADYLTYTWWPQQPKIRQALGDIPFEKGETIDVATLTKERWQDAIGNQDPYWFPHYLISITGIFEKKFYERLLRYDRRLLPYFFTKLFYKVTTLLLRFGFRFHQRIWFNKLNRMLRYRLPRFSQETPFNLEKASGRFDMLPFRLALPKQELFACIDDDNDPADRGSSLVARGLYPISERLLRWDMNEEPEKHRAESRLLKKGEYIGDTYCFYHGKGTRVQPVREHIKVLSGAIKISVGDETLTLQKGEGASFYTNIPYGVAVIEESQIIRYTPNIGLDPSYTSGEHHELSKAHVRAILKEIGAVLAEIREEETYQLIKEIMAARRIVTAGAGRVGLATRGFAMRLGHLGFDAYAHGDMTVPSVGGGHLLLVASGSGETPTVAHIVEIAKNSKARIALLTGNPASRMGKLADIIVTIPAPNKANPGRIRSIQPMTTLNEQSLQIYFDSLVLALMKELNTDEKLMWERHSNLE